MSAHLQLPRVYPIIDAARFDAFGFPGAMFRFAEELVRGGATLIQYRDKFQNASQMLSCARELRRITHQRAEFIMNDRTDLCIAADADGVHLGQDDLSPVAARRIFHAVEQASGPRKCLWIGLSTHNPDQALEASRMPVDYIAAGPVFTTATKAKADPVIGLDGVRTARAATTKPLVAIGGITRENCRKVMEAGADAVAVISDLLGSPAKALEDFLRILG